MEGKGGDEYALGLLAHAEALPGGDDAKPRRGGDAAGPSLSARSRQKLLLAGAFCVLFMIAEVVGGYLAGSLAIMTECVCGGGEGRWERRRSEEGGEGMHCGRAEPCGVVGVHGWEGVVIQSARAKQRVRGGCARASRG
jgi:hypothetical protein